MEDLLLIQAKQKLGDPSATTFINQFYITVAPSIHRWFVWQTEKKKRNAQKIGKVTVIMFRISKQTLTCDNSDANVIHSIYEWRYNKYNNLTTSIDLTVTNYTHTQTNLINI